MKVIPSRRNRSLIFPVAGAFATFVFAALSSGVAHAGFDAPCAGMVFETRPGSEFDEGWTGAGHDRPLVSGVATSLDVLKRCSSDQAPCQSNADCAAGSCVATCDCNVDPTCELTGPVGGKKCLNSLTDCTTNVDCPASAACVSMFGPPLPFSVSSTAFCAVTHFEGAASGSFDSATGETSLSATLRRRTFIGITGAQPCPRCGAPNQDPSIGDIFTCEGGQFPGAACTVEGVTPSFGGTSSACPPEVPDNVTGSGLLIHLDNLTTGDVTKTAKLACTGTGFTANPLTPASNPKCIDDTAGAVCASNADCKRCTGDPSVKCSGNGDCTGNGTCAAAPDQPVTCGFWCHCGFCNNDVTRPCFDSSECPDGQTCAKGSGSPGSTTAPQPKPNNCSQDTFICGGAETERCKNTQSGSCSLQPYRTCTSNDTCEINGAGTCILGGRPCFESGITRNGAPSPAGTYCAFEDKTCSTNADCVQSGDFCVKDSSRPQMVDVLCLAGTTSSAINTVVGLPGPAATSLASLVRVCRCGAGEPGCQDICGETGGGCGDGIVQAGEECDGGACCAGDCSLLDPGTTCRTSGGTCDTAETCNGSSAACPANAFKPSTTPCRASAGVCDVSESCSGTSAGCPVDGFVPSTTVCRAGANACDMAERCDGTSSACPANLPQPDGAACDDGDSCTTEECIGGVCQSTPIPDCNATCGNGEVDDGEGYDDGNATFTLGEYCGVDCVQIPCGKPTNSSGVLPKSSDALFVLKVAVQQATCSPRVCSVDGNSTVLASDALRILKAAVQQPVTLDCPGA